MKKNIAVLLTCYNRIAKTLSCLHSLYRAKLPPGYELEIYLTDDHSSDGTPLAVREQFPKVHLIEGSGCLFWAGGMRLAWETAMKQKHYDAFLLINDDVSLFPSFFYNLLDAERYALAVYGVHGIYSGATADPESGQLTYGGSRVRNHLLVVRIQMITPGDQPKRCDVCNANILWVSSDVTARIGIFDRRFTHGIADYDYSLRARKAHIPVLLAAGVCGFCSDDHGNNWPDVSNTLRERVAYLKSPKGLACDEYLCFIMRHFPLYLPYSYLLLWLKTLFPVIWNRYRQPYSERDETN